VISGAHVDPLTRHSPALRSTGRIMNLAQKVANELTKLVGNELYHSKVAPFKVLGLMARTRGGELFIKDFHKYFS